MNTINETISVQRIPWFKSWFDSTYYHKLYGNRDEKEAAGFVDEVVALLHPRHRATMLDVGCGAGRHCKHLASKGFNVMGIDLSLASIRQAKKSETSFLKFLQHDMRQPFGNNCFDYVFNFFTSFGYFKNQLENQRVIRNMSASLKPDGKLVLDYLNVQYSEDRLVANEEKEIDGIIYHLTRWYDKDFFYKKIEVRDGQMGEPLEHTEQVARFGLDDFKFMMTLNRLEIEEVYGDYQLNSYDSRKSPRLIIVAKKSNEQ